MDSQSNRRRIFCYCYTIMTDSSPTHDILSTQSSPSSYHDNNQENHRRQNRRQGIQQDAGWAPDLSAIPDDQPSDYPDHHTQSLNPCKISSASFVVEFGFLSSNAFQIGSSEPDDASPEPLCAVVTVRAPTGLRNRRTCAAIAIV